MFQRSRDLASKFAAGVKDAVASVDVEAHSLVGFPRPPGGSKK